MSVLRLGRDDAPAIVMLHGLRDTAWSLTPIAARLHQALGVQIAIMELRGHGASDPSEAYAMPNFLMDVHEVVKQLPGPVGLFGHSLGGHITYKFSALFPELVTAALIVEGLGPPKRAHHGDEGNLGRQRAAGRQCRNRGNRHGDQARQQARQARKCATYQCLLSSG